MSVTVELGMAWWPDDLPIVLQRSMDIGRGDERNLSHLAMGVHSGTHIDGPVHFMHQAAGISAPPIAMRSGHLPFRRAVQFKIRPG